MALSSDAEVFLTSELSGCSVMIGGSLRSPTFIHACGTCISALDLKDAVEDDPLLTSLVAPSTALFKSNEMGLARAFGVRNDGCWRFYGQSCIDFVRGVPHFDTESLWPDCSRHHYRPWTNLQTRSPY